MGPLAGYRIVELKGLGPGPYAGMLLADMGAEVIVVERSSRHRGAGPSPASDIHSRGKRSIVLDVKVEAGLELLLSLVERADAFIEGFRPGVAERLGCGPDACFARNAKLVYGRITGWGQSGPLSQAAGHDINYIALAGALAAIGGKDKPVPPLNLVGDFAGGSLFMVIGMLAAMLHARSTGEGQVVDAAIVDGTANLMSLFHTLHSVGAWSTERESNLLDGGAHFYNVYETADGKFVSVGPIEPKFYALLIEKAGLNPAVFEGRQAPEDWPELKRRLQIVFRSKSRDAWCDILEGTDACFAPVLDFQESPQHAHNIDRATYIDIDGVTQPSPAPRFSRTACETPESPRAPGADGDAILAELGFNAREISQIRRSGALG